MARKNQSCGHKIKIEVIKSLKNTYKQFGASYLAKKLLTKIITPVYKSTSFYVLSVQERPAFSENKHIIVYDATTIEKLEKSNIELPTALDRQINNFIVKSRVILYILDDQVAGWGFVQESGISDYAQYKFRVPSQTELLKNLYVLPEFRGKSIGKYINEHRIKTVPKGKIPIVFVMTENKYAIRNLEMFGFKKQVKVVDKLWFRNKHKRNITLLSDHSSAEIIESGFL